MSGPARLTSPFTKLVTCTMFPKPQTLGPMRVRPQVIHHDTSFVLALIAGLWLSNTVAHTLDLPSREGKITGLISSTVGLIVVMKITKISPEGISLLKALILYQLSVVLWTTVTNTWGIGMSNLLGLDPIIDIHGLLESLGLILLLVRCLPWILQWLVDRQLLSPVMRYAQIKKPLKTG